MTPPSLIGATVALVAVILAGCVENACYDRYSVEPVSPHVSTEGWTVVDLDRAQNLSRFGIIVNMLEAARDPANHSDKANEFSPGTAVEQDQMDRAKEQLDQLAMQQNNATANTIRYKGGLYHLVIIHGPGCVR